MNDDFAFAPIGGDTSFEMEIGSEGIATTAKYRNITEPAIERSSSIDERSSNDGVSNSSDTPISNVVAEELSSPIATNSRHSMSDDTELAANDADTSFEMEMDSMDSATTATRYGIASGPAIE